jgi:hypothetical protein
MEPGKGFTVKLLGGIQFSIIPLENGGHVLEYSKPAGIIDGKEMRSVTATAFPECSAEAAVNCYKAFVEMISEKGFDPAEINQEVLLSVLSLSARVTTEEAQ